MRVAEVSKAGYLNLLQVYPPYWGTVLRKKHLSSEENAEVEDFRVILRLVPSTVDPKAFELRVDAISKGRVENE
jgi:hypothetical protein